YLDIANNKLNAPPPTLPQGLPASFAAMFISSGDERAFYRAELKELDSAAATAIAKTTDRSTKVHLESVRDQIAKILDPDKAPGPNQRSNAFAMEMLELLLDPTSCWPDYEIKP